MCVNGTSARRESSIPPLTWPLAHSSPDASALRHGVDAARVCGLRREGRGRRHAAAQLHGCQPDGCVPLFKRPLALPRPLRLACRLRTCRRNTRFVLSAPPPPRLPARLQTVCTRRRAPSQPGFSCVETASPSSWTRVTRSRWPCKTVTWCTRRPWAAAPRAHSLPQRRCQPWWCPCLLRRPSLPQTTTATVTATATSQRSRLEAALQWARRANPPNA